MERLRVALAGTFRPIFHGDMKAVLRHSMDVMKKKSAALEFDFMPVDKGMETLADAEAAARQLEERNTDLIIIQNSSFADGDMILPFLRTSARLCVWAVKETTTSGPLPLNSFCATNLYMSIAGRYSPGYQKPVKWLYGDVESEGFGRRLDTTIRALTAIKNLRTSKILMVGDLVPGYHDENFDPETLRALFGVTIEKHELGEFYAEYESATRDETVTAKAAQIRRESRGADASRADIAKSAAAEIAFQRIIAKHGGSAITFRCWPEVPAKIGLMVCSTIGRLNQTGTVAATETDILGAVSMLTLKYLSGRETVLMDLSGWDQKSDSVYVWHCGNIPRNWFNRSGFRLANHFNRDTIGVVREGRMKPGTVTGLRFHEKDASAFLLTGRFTDKKSPVYKGCSSWMKDLAINAQPVSSRDFLNTLLVNGVPHHLAYVDRDLVTDVNELCAWLGIGVINPVLYRDYLQTPLGMTRPKP